MSKESDNESSIRKLQGKLIELGYILKFGADGHMSPGGETMLAVLDALSHAPEIATFPSDEKTAVVPPVDSRSETNILTLHPRFQPMARAFIARIRSELGDFRITSGTRTYAEQDELYAQGRTKPGKIVTGARAGYSNHNYGLAFDITLFEDGQPVWNSPLYRKAGEIGERMGMDWLGGGSGEDIGDEPHFEWPGATDNIDTYRSRKASGLDVLV